MRKNLDEKARAAGVMGAISVREVVEQLPRDLPSLTSLRALAALLVFLFHLDRWGVIDLPGAGVGETGVAFFFVLSGFLLTWGHTGRAGVRRFYVRRFARIWPSHAAVWIVALLVPVTDFPRSWWTAGLNLLLLQAWVPVDRAVFGMNGVAWSLSCEVAFYALFPLVLLLLVHRRRRALLVVALLAFLGEAVVAVAAASSAAPPWLAVAGFTFPLVRLPEFLLGVAGAALLRRGWRPSAATTIVVVVLCAVGFAFAHGRPADDVWSTPVYLLVILLAARRDLRLAPGPLDRAWIVHLGKLSFAFYLVHELVITNLRHLLGAGPAVAALAFVVSAAAAVALHHGVELPAQRFLVRRLRATSAVTPSDGVRA